jgi:type I restriction enzyme S subunit
MVTTKGNSVGRTSYVPLGTPEFVYSPHLSYWRSVDSSKLSSRFLRYWSKSPEFSAQLYSMAHGTDMAPYLSLADQRRLRISLPSIFVQEAVAEVLGSLDGKIAVNEQIAGTARQLARMNFRAVIQTGDAEKGELSLVVEFLSRGVAARYSIDKSQLRLLNQKCIRDNRVSVTPSRRTLTDKVPNAKMLQMHDVLVNSTGVGTLGRVARWTKQEACTVDSHVTIVRFDAARVDPVCAGFAMLDAEPEIEALGEGSTGQTELSRAQLSALRIAVPSRDRVGTLRPLLDALESRGNSALEESNSLAALRDTLLPKLMSGEIRVREAEKVVEEVT